MVQKRRFEYVLDWKEIRIIYIKKIKIKKKIVLMLVKLEVNKF